MMRVLKIISVCLILAAANLTCASEYLPPKKMLWSFDGFFGKFDREAAQRGFQVYKEVCAACHGLKHLSFRQLEALGFSEAEIKELAKEHTVSDGSNDQGEMFERPGLPSDMMTGPFANEQAARAANNGAYPPDLSLIIKARHDGANYLFSLLTGYSQTPPAELKIMDGLSYNPYFPSLQIAMPAPLTEGQVTYQDGTHASVEQMARDVTIFLQWAAEPEMEHRKSLGLKVVLFLTIFTILFYVSKQRIWAKVN